MESQGLPSIFDTIDLLIRQGQIDRAQVALKLLIQDSSRREEALALATLCRRAGLSGHSIRLLFPYVRPKARNPIAPEPQEIAEYAASLIRLEATHEAENLLRSIAESGVPEVSLYQAFARIHVWDYASAEKYLRKFLSHPIAPPYLKTIAQVNLAAALIFQENSGSKALLESLLEETARTGNSLLHGNCLLLSAQAALTAGNFQPAQEFLDQGEQLLDQQGKSRESNDAFLLRKWRTILKLKAGDSESLAALRQEARVRRNYETLRDLDYHEALVSNSRELWTKLYFGTPYDSYRKRILKSVELTTLPKTYHWISEFETAPTVRPRRFIDPTGDLKPGQVLHRLYEALCSDFYKPQSAVALFTKVFPGEIYNPLTAPNRVHQALKRLRVKVGVREFGGVFYLDPGPKKGLKIRCLQETTLPRSLELVRQFVSEKFGRIPFQARDLAGHLALGRSSRAELLAELVSRGHLLKLGSGPRTRYQLRE